VPGNPVIKSITKNTQTRQELVIVGTDTTKEELVTRLNVRESGPGYVHFPKLEDGSAAQGFTEEFFVALTNEGPRAKMVNGVRRIYWEKIQSHLPNEAWDCLVLAKAALAFSENQMLDLNKLERPTVSAEEKEKPQLWGTVTSGYRGDLLRPRPQPGASQLWGN
jgi:phage terminase large subunit GpA-like protein